MYGKEAYTGYREATKARSLISGAELPMWAELPIDLKRAWNLAASAVITAACHEADRAIFGEKRPSEP